MQNQIGIDSWRSKIKCKYSNIVTIDGCAETYDTKIIESADFVFFYVGFMNHSTYYKSLNSIKKNNTPFAYITKTNIELVENEMANIIINLGLKKRESVLSA